MSRLAQSNRVKYSFDKQSLIIIITSLVFSKLFYCSCVWGNTSQINSKMLRTVQNFACCIVSGRRKYDHVSPALKELRWLPVKEHLYYRDAIMSFKCLTGCAPGYLFTQCIRRCDVTNRRTRSSQMLNIPRFGTASGQRTFCYRGFARQPCCMAGTMKMFCIRKNIFSHGKKNLLFLPCNMAAVQNLYRAITLWNSISNDLKLCESVNVFKRSLRSRLLSKFSSSTI